jgi:Tfp pilus assembly protein PilF
MKGELSIPPCDASFPHKREIGFSITVFAVFIFSIYANCFDCSWQLDDFTNITSNPRLHLEELSWERLKTALFSDPGQPGTLYRPVVSVSLALNHYFGGLDVFGYHLVNVLIHLATTLFLFLFVHQTLNLPSLKEEYARKSYSIALLSSLIWAIHPVQTQAVTYIVQRMTSLSGMFYVMGMYFYARAKTTEEGKTGISLILLSFIAFVLAFGAKENAIMLPVSLLLYEALVVGRSWPRRKGFLAIILLGSTILLGMLYIHWRKGGVLSFLTEYEGRPFSLAQRVLTEPRIILFYVSLLLYPVPNRFSIAHSVGISSSLLSPVSTGISILVIACAVALLILRGKRHPLISFSFLFFFLNHIPESTVLPLELVFEHRNYVPSMLFFVPFVMGFCRLLERYKAKKTMTFAICVFAVFIIISLGHSTYLRNFAWKNPETLWSAALERAPDQLRVHHNLGLYYQNQGLMGKAMKAYHKALESPVTHRRNETFMTHYQLGRLYSELGDDEQAKRHYLEAVRLEPNLSLALVNLTALYDRENNQELADYYLIEAFKVNHKDPLINLNMGIWCLRNGRVGEAIQHLNMAREETSLEARTLLYLGIAYKIKGWFGRAATCFQKAIRMDEQNITPQLHLLEIYYRKGHKAKSRDEAQRVAHRLLENESLFHRTVTLICEKGSYGDVQLDAHIVLPLIRESMAVRLDALSQRDAWLKKLLDKEDKFR